jgi:hypothetical protein
MFAEAGAWELSTVILVVDAMKKCHSLSVPASI